MEWININDALPNINEDVIIKFSDGSEGQAYRVSNSNFRSSITDALFASWPAYWIKDPNVK